MKNVRIVRSTDHLVLEVSRLTDRRVSVVVSIPGREGTSSRIWPADCPWLDLQASVLETLSTWLYLTGGHQERLPET